MKYQVILVNDETLKHNYYYSYFESNDTTLGNISTDSLPPYQDINKARSCYWDGSKWVYDKAKYNAIKAEIEEKEIENLVNLSDSQKLSLFASAIQVEEAPKENGVVLPKKLGFMWKPICNITNGTPCISWQLVTDPLYVPVNDGSDYLEAIEWHNGDTVTEGLWYNVGDNLIWQAKKSGSPKDSTDTEYFDIP